MRWIIPVVLLAAATPAAAQNTQFDLDNLRMQQQLQQQRSIDQSNQFMALEARQRAEQAAVAAQAQRLLPERLSSTPYATVPPATRSQPIKTPSVPDAALADSNRRVQDAANNRH